MRLSKAKYHRTWLRLHKEYEQYAYPIIKKALDDQIKPVLKMIREDNYDVIETYLPYIMNTDPIRNALFEIYPKIGSRAANFSYDYITDPFTRKALSFFNAEWIQEMVDYFLTIAGQKIQGITDTTLKYIQTVLADVQMRNLSRREQARELEKLLNSTDFNRARALTIARTESTTAANKGIQLGAESTDYVVEKFWIATYDKRARTDHMAAGNQPPIPLNVPFIVGGIPMMYPGEVSPEIPASQVINCRCVQAVQAVEDEDGLPILKARSNKINL